ncbi:MAG: bifunctional prephenate dehydrogenase/3-phosphoshikimate 1-carboxyvinyltransferase [Pseudomonadales bacterium]|nr:bifunctional prephenate dehydrogenase/3-phosphoshikimate 1-carboxyvinyltransferase [Pseudomonadales bacterium]
MVDRQDKNNAKEPKIKKLVIIGLGLIGGSLALALRRADYVGTIVGCSRSQSTLDKALQMGMIDQGELDVAVAVRNADMVVLAAPILSTQALFESMKNELSDHTIITDAGSVKRYVVEAAKNVFGHIPPQLVPGHPIAGSEKSGVTAADVGLYRHHNVILTPMSETDEQAVTTVRLMWESVGANVIQMDVDHHDEVLAATSHLPHLLAFSLVDTLAGKPDNKEIFKYAAGGFRDFTRIAASDPTMWHNIFVANQNATLKVLDQFSTGLAELRTAIQYNDGEKVLGVFTRAKVAREHFSLILEHRAYEKQQQIMNTKKISFVVKNGGCLKGEIRVPGDKSISHRSIMLGSLAEGVTEVEGFLEGEDSLATLQAFRDMGVVIEGPVNGHVKIFGVGLLGLQPPRGPLYLGNSGTSMRLLSGLLAPQSFDVELSGDESLTKRPMGRVSNPLTSMGANIEAAAKGTPPLKIKGGQVLKGIDYDMPMASAQVKSCVLLAGLFAEGKTSVTEPAPTRDHTERMLRGFGYQVETQGSKVSLTGGGTLTGTSIEVPADISSAAFFMVAASIAENSDITLKHVGINPTRIGVVNILKAMGADIEINNTREVGGEPVADIRVRSAALKGIRIPEDQVPLAIDEFPALFIAAACAEGETVLTGAEELRVKESDRIQVMADGLVALGVDAKSTLDGIVIQGGKINGGEVDSYDDHRIAMSFSIAALKSDGPIRINDCANVATSFPNFVELLTTAGMSLEVTEMNS